METKGLGAYGQPVNQHKVRHNNENEREKNECDGNKDRRSWICSWPTEGQVKKLEQVFRAFGEEAKGKKCEGTVGLLAEGDEIAAEFKGSPAINAALISAAQKVEHYEMASYGCLHEWAGRLGNAEAAGVLQAILEQETAANEKLTELAEAGWNEEALGADGSDDAM